LQKSRSATGRYLIAYDHHSLGALQEGVGPLIPASPFVTPRLGDELALLLHWAASRSLAEEILVVDMGPFLEMTIVVTLNYGLSHQRRFWCLEGSGKGPPRAPGIVLGFAEETSSC
jgi:hypothetical protein